MKGFISSSYTDETWEIYEDVYDLKAWKFDDLTHAFVQFDSPICSKRLIFETMSWSTCVDLQG